jgi:hypothetical protein
MASYDPRLRETSSEAFLMTWGSNPEPDPLHGWALAIFLAVIMGLYLAAVLYRMIFP